MRIFNTVFFAAAALFFCFGTALSQQIHPQPETPPRHQAQEQAQPQPQPHQPGIASPDDISDKDLQKFVDASNKIEPIQREASEEIKEIIRAEDMDIERFQQLIAARQNPEMSAHIGIEQEEISKIEKMEPQITELQKKLSHEVIEAITDCGLTVERFEIIYLSLRQHPELVHRLENLLSRRQP